MNEKKVFLHAIFLLVYSRLVLKFKTFKEILNHFGSRSCSEIKYEGNAMPPTKLVALLEAAGKLVPFTTCLSKALAGSVLMRRYGFDTKLHIGVAKESNDVLEAHAWLSLDGRIIVGKCPDLQRFNELPSIFNKDSR